MESVRSIGEQMQTITCPRPSRKRADDRVVEFFLHAYRGGRFSGDPKWLPQDKKNVEVIASDADCSLAIEHTRVFAFEDHKYKEEIFRPVATYLEDLGHQMPEDGCYCLTFPADLLDSLNAAQRMIYQRDLKEWLAVTLPDLPISDTHHLRCPSPKSVLRNVTLDVQVWDSRPTQRGIHVNGYLPADADRLIPVIRKALHDKVPKLANAAAQEKLLMIEMPMISDSHTRALEIIRDLGEEIPAFSMIDHVVIAQTFGLEEDHGVIYFFVWNRPSHTWSRLPGGCC